MARRYLGGIYMSSRTLNRGDRVTKRRAGGLSNVGTVLFVYHDKLAGRCATVRWDAGSEQLCLTADLRRQDRGV